MWEGRQEDNGTREEASFQIYRCPRFNRRYQSAYRRFRVEPPIDETSSPDVTGDIYDGSEPDDHIAQTVGAAFRPADEVEVEPAPRLESEAALSEKLSGEAIEEMKDQLEKSAREDEEAREQDERGASREGLRAIFATESDLTAETSQAEPYGELQRQEETSDWQEPYVEPESSLRTSKPQTEKLVWKSFPKPLRRK
ncbi:MAG: hypothetical protein WBH35_01235 [Bacillota bacterium]|jgi:hypothetical protein|nr:hypothetical protein [Bacillota bacterium]